MEGQLITSTQNPKVKRVVALVQKSSFRRETGLFVVEGCREVQHCLDAGFEPEAVFKCPEIINPHQTSLFQWEKMGQGNVNCYDVTPEVYAKMAFRGSTEGVLAVMRARTLSLADLQTRLASVSNPLFVVLEKVEKPGNVGAVLRSADAAGADAVIVCDPLTDLYNPNLIRSSIGAVFTVPTMCCTSEDCIAWLKERNVAILTAQLQDSRSYYDADMTGATAIVMGTESTGLTEQWRQAADAHIRIPMQGRLDSLNVSVSAAILLFEAVRQRGGNRS